MASVSKYDNDAIIKSRWVPKCHYYYIQIHEWGETYLQSIPMWQGVNSPCTELHKWFVSQQTTLSVTQSMIIDGIPIYAMT